MTTINDEYGLPPNTRRMIEKACHDLESKLQPPAPVRVRIVKNLNSGGRCSYNSGRFTIHVKAICALRMVEVLAHEWAHTLHLHIIQDIGGIKYKYGKLACRMEDHSNQFADEFFKKFYPANKNLCDAAWREMRPLLDEQPAVVKTFNYITGKYE